MTILYKILGSISLLMGVIGAFLPVMPTTCFVLLAAWCFAKSSPAWHAKLRHSQYFGNMIQRWEQQRTIPETARKIALGSMLISGVYTVLFINNVFVKCFVICLLLMSSVAVNHFREPSQDLPKSID